MAMSHGPLDGSKPVVMIFNQHPTEWWAPYAILEFARLVRYGPYHDATLWSGILDSFSFYFVPTFVPWGWQNSTIKNSRGVNTNRNWDTSVWESQLATGAASDDPAHIQYRGESPASEAETQKMQSTINQLSPWMFIDIHTANIGGTYVQSDTHPNRPLHQNVWADFQHNLDFLPQFIWDFMDPLSCAVRWGRNRTDTQGRAIIGTMTETAQNVPNPDQTLGMQYIMTGMFIWCAYADRFWRTGRMFWGEHSGTAIRDR
jgi:hypothetical protein